MDVSARFLAFALHGAGWVLWLLVALSVASVAVMLERLWYFRTHQLKKAVLMADMRALLQDGTTSEAIERGLPPADTDVAAALEGAKARGRARPPVGPRRGRRPRGGEGAGAAPPRAQPLFPCNAGVERAVHRPVRHGA